MLNKALTLFLAFLMIFSLTACSGYTQEDVDRLVDRAYEQGYNDALSGSDSGNGDVSALIRDAIFDCELTAAGEGLHPEEALVVFEDYLNGEYVSKQDLWTALDSLSVYYYQSLRIDEYVEKFR